MAKHTKHNPDYQKNRTADVVIHGNKQAISGDHWQVNMDLTPAGNESAWGAFLPRSGKDRPTTHVKINECDH